ncbi:hypothetical protein BH10ACI4_BH10ACI4_27510 [soil metagenome]
MNDLQPLRPCHPARIARLAALLCLLLFIPSLRAQTMEDGIMLGRNLICFGSLYTRDSWTQYWEGTLQRTNGNIGTITTQSVNLAANYGVTSRINVLASAPYVWTNASQGVLKGQSGIQDISLAVKYNVLRAPMGRIGTVRGIVVAYGSIPLTNYSPDFLPLSIGMQSRTVGGRATLNYQGRNGLYLNGTGAYTFRGNVVLDRSSYFTNGQLYLSNEVAMPNVFDYNLSAGYKRGDLVLTAAFAQQQTRGGGDIRRQDMPFVSNRMDASRVGFNIQYPLPIHRLRNLQYWVAYRNTFNGRNVGQANTLTTGLMYTLHFEKRATP